MLRAYKEDEGTHHREDPEDHTTDDEEIKPKKPYMDIEAPPHHHPVAGVQTPIASEPLFTPLNVILFVGHIVMWTCWTTLIKYVRGDNPDYPFEIVTVVLMMELVKLILTIGFHCYANKTTDVIGEIRKWGDEWRVGMYFIVPAGIYTIYNWLLYLNLVFFDPVSYRVLINMRILFSGLLVQILFKKRLGAIKWAALGLLALGCAINQITEDFQIQASLLHIGTITVQAFSSSLGGTYNEYLLKMNVDMGINQKNAYLYTFSLTLNSLLIIIAKPHLLSVDVFFEGWTGLVWFIVVLGAFCGFTTALFLRHLNVILKEYAHGGEMFATAFVSNLVFATPLNAKILLSIFLTSVSVVLYSRG
jgi:drug/metabolite transporter (DMT)-like permease